MLSDPVAEAFGLIHRHPSGENLWYGLLTLLRLRRCAVGLDRTSYDETVTKNIILHDFSVERWGFSKTYGTDPDSTGFKRLEWMICSWVCSASSSENEEEVGVLARFPIQRHRNLRSEITEIDVRGRTHFVLLL